MGALTIGRVGLDVDMDHMAAWEERKGFNEEQTVFRGFLKSTSIEFTKYLRAELLEQQGAFIAVTYSGDDFFDGFYILTDVFIDTIQNSYLGAGLFPFEISLYRIGSLASTELQSLITAADIDNDFGSTPQYWHAVPPGTLSYNAGPDASATEYARESVDGNVAFYVNVQASWDPTWSIEPASYYLAASEIWYRDRLRAGLLIPENDPTNWYITNGLIEVRAATFQGSSNGQIELRPYDGTQWDSWLAFDFWHDDTNEIPSWHFFTILRNTPELVTVRLMRDARPITSSSIHTMDISLRRGSHYASFVWTYTSSHAGSIRRAATDAATRPGGNASYIYDASTNEGHRWILGAPREFIEDETNGRITFDVEERVHPFWIGFVINNAANDSGDGPADLTRQYTGWVSETVRGVRR